jgi:hypothetical protein
VGIGPYRFKDLFSISHSSGKKISRQDKKTGQIVEYVRANQFPRFEYDSKIFEAVLNKEIDAVKRMKDWTNEKTELSDKMKDVLNVS